MKAHHWLTLALLCSAASASAQVASQTNAALVPAAADAYHPVQHGRDHIVWERYRPETNHLGRITIQTNRCVELQTGKHHLQNGRWVDSSEEIQLDPKGAVATNGPHKVGFTANINSPVSVAVITPDNTTLKIRPAGLVYFDFHARRSALIAELKDSGGLVVGTNQVLYPDAFTGLRADVRYTYKKSGLEQDVILLQRPPLPEAYGLNPTTTWLWVLTEFTDPPADIQVVREIRRGWKQSTVDKIIRIGGMSIGPGTAFSLGLGQDRRTGVPVEKHWTVIDDRTFLIEEVSFRRIVPHLRNLQASAEPAPGPGGSPTRRLASNTLFLPAVRVASASATNTVMQIARALPQMKGLVLDFDLQSGTDVVLQGDQTYVVTGTVNLTNTVIEGGTVVKYARGASLNLIGPVQCLTGPYRPAIFTALDDDSVGSPISTGPLDGTYADCALSLGLGGDLHHLNIRYAKEAIHCGNNDYSVNHSQFLFCGVGFHSETANFTNSNILMCQVATNFYGSFFHGLVEHLTSDQAVRLVWDYDFEYLPWCYSLPSSTLALVNTLTASITNGYGFPVAIHHAQNFPSAAGVFQTVGAASYYLVDGSTNRNTGTTNIQPALADSLKTKTTCPPIVYSNVTISTDTTFAPQAQRDTDTPDLGYHYDALDYAFKQTRVTNATLRLLPGTAVTAFGQYGIGLLSGSRLLSEGAPDSRNHIARYNLVQEGASTNWNGSGGSIVGDFLGGTPSAQAFFRFTDWSMPAQDGCHFSTWDRAMVNSFSDCQFHGGTFWILAPSIAITNCLFERVNASIDDSYSMPLSPVVANCLFYGGQLTVTHWESDDWVFRDNLFDQVQINQDGDFANAYSGYTPGTTRLSPTNANDVVASITYETGPLGNYYLPTNSSLINTGSAAANLVGLYHYTTQTNQLKETTSLVDIGYHYVAVNGSGVAADSDGDGFSDYLEDADGNGTYDASDPCNWAITDTDGDGVNDYWEWVQGRNPRVTGTVSDASDLIRLRVFTPLAGAGNP